MPQHEYVCTNSPVPGFGTDRQANAIGNQKPRTFPKTTLSGVLNTGESLLYFFLVFIALRHLHPTGIMLYQGVALES